MVDEVPNQKHYQKMLALSKVALEEAQKDMDSGHFDEVSDTDQEGESESRQVSPSGMTEAMEGVEVGGKAKQAEPPKGKVDRLRVRITTNILQVGIRSDPSEPGKPYGGLRPGPRDTGVGTKHGRSASDDVRGHALRSPPPSSLRMEQEQTEDGGDEDTPAGEERRRSGRQSRRPDWYGRGR
jgi:hypothetical protein